MRKLQYGLLFLLLGIGVCLAVSPGQAQSAAQPELAGAIGALAAKAPAGYVGSAACATCHIAQSRAWATSHHAQAMSVATPETVRGDFSGQKVESAGSSGRFFKQNGQFLVETEGRDGKLETFKVSHTFGLEPLQQYLVSFPDGRLQALPWAWDTRPKAEGGQKWFHVYGASRSPRRAIPCTGPGSQQNLEYHVRGMPFDRAEQELRPASKAIATTFAEISVGCEACHGPALGHLAWAAHRRARTTITSKGFADPIPKRPPSTGSRIPPRQPPQMASPVPPATW